MDSYGLFKKTIWDYYNEHKRIMPWREDTSAYNVFISEVMLQQTQVSRVMAKFPLFKKAFPDFKSLAASQTPDLLSVWQGMGYNRRALYLRQAARIIEDQYDGHLPKSPAFLDELPGIGWATACSITAFAFNIPVAFIETNIRRVYIHHFFQEEERVSDSQILPHVENTVDQDNPREWYWAIMDYSTYLAKKVENPNIKSVHYVKQSKFAGSVREVRGGVIRALLKSPLTRVQLDKLFPDQRLDTALAELLKEDFIFLNTKKKYSIK